MAQNTAILEETGRKGQQLTTALGILKGIDLKNIAPEGVATASSLAIAYSHYVLSLAQSLPAEQRMAIEAQVKQVIEAVERAATKAEAAIAEQQGREKTTAVQAEFDRQPTLSETLQQQASSLPKDALKAELKATLSVQAAQEFTALRGVLDNPAIASEFVPFEVMAELVNSVLAPNEAAEFLVRETVVNGTHQILTNYVGNETIMPDLTVSMVDNFRNVEQNQQFVAQCDEVQQRLEQQRQEIVARAEEIQTPAPVQGDVERIEMIRRAIAEVSNTRVVAKTAIGKESVLDTLKSFGINARSVVDTESNIKQPRFIVKEEDGQKITLKLESVEEDNIAAKLFQAIRESKQRNILALGEVLEGKQSDVKGIVSEIIKASDLERQQQPLDLKKLWTERAKITSQDNERTPR